jgi:hypothetical protein
MDDWVHVVLDQHAELDPLENYRFDSKLIGAVVLVIVW